MKIKKIFACALAMVTLVACGSNTKKEEKSSNDSKTKVEEKASNDSKEEKAGNDEKSTNETSNDKSVTLKAGEEWVVDGQWKLVVNSVKSTDGRNEYADSNPAQVVIIDYTYENIGFNEDLDGLYFSPSSVIDGNGEISKEYPLADGLNYPASTPKGAKMANAQIAYGLNNESDKIKIVFDQYVENKDKQLDSYKATIEAEVQK